MINEFLQKRVTLPKASLQYLFVADRIAHQEEVILPALEKGQIVLSHRCFWSAIPYGIMDRSNGGYNYSVGDTLLVTQSVLSMYHQITIPDVTFYLDVSAQTSLKRLKDMRVSAEYYETKERLENVEKGYKWMIEKFPDEFTLIRGEESVDKVTEEIIKNLESRIQNSE
ncbi:MAG: deoxynucleoside kinase [Candidatus Levybacteria bacterium]|nr:deoxynucleoside kinase [Candidatus Levybacteria bacterium]